MLINVLKVLVLCALVPCIQGVFAQEAEKNQQYKPSENPLNVWVGGWYDWNPYQYLKKSDDPNSLTGLDIEFSKLMMEKLKKRYEISPVSWKQHQEDIVSGKRQFATGAFDTPERRKLMYVSKSYRDEENSYFLLKENERKNSYRNVDGFLKYIKENRKKIGVIDGYKFADSKVNDYVNDPKNADLIVKSKTDLENMHLTLEGKIDGFLADRVVGATILWQNGYSKKISEKYLGIKAPIHMLLSRSTVTAEEAMLVDKYIDEIKGSADFSRIINWYYYPILLMQTTDTFWFFMLEILGILAFSISGLILASRIQTTLLGAFLLAFLPAVGGGVLRDISFGRYPIWIVQNKSYMFLLIGVVLVGFLILKIFEKFHIKTPKKFYNFTENVMVVTDAIGLSVFTIVGVIISMVVKTDPLWLWGPFFAFLTGAGGGMLRDIFVKTKNVDIICGEIYAELAILWGLIFSIYLTYTVDDIRPEKITHAVIFCFFGCFITRMIFHYFKVPNIRFGAEKRL